MDNQRKRNKNTVYGVTFGVLGFPSSYGHKRMETNLGPNFPVLTSFALFQEANLWRRNGGRYRPVFVGRSHRQHSHPGA